jgi:hypothetical protein
MFSIISNATKEANEDYGLATAIIVCIILLGIVFGLLCGVIAIATALWNGCVHDVFNLPEVTFWQMWGIYLVCDILFKPAIPSNRE